MGQNILRQRPETIDGLTWVIPMAGNGVRTQLFGEFKPFIEINGHAMFSWFLSSIKVLVKPNDHIIVITTKYFSEKYAFVARIHHMFQHCGLNNRISIITTEGTPPGVTATLLHAETLIKNSGAVMIIYPDQYIDFDLPEVIEQETGYLGLYLSFGYKSGFVDIQNGLITKFVEKQNISNIASSGVYLVSSGQKMISAMKRQIQSGETLKNEYYFGPCFNYLINDGFHIYPLPIRCKYDLGDPEGIVIFSKRNFICK